MPAFVEDDSAPPAEQPNLIIAEQEYKTPVVDVRKEGYDSLATFFSGSKLRCNYYQTIQRRDTAASSFQVDLPIPYAQRRLIEDFEVILDGKIDHKQNINDSAGFATTGRAVCYGVIVPQPGDVFIAQLGKGRNTLIQINAPERLTPFDESGYSFEFKALRWMDEESQRELDRTVVQHYYFDRENFRNGLKCLLRKEDVDVMRRLAASWRRLIHLFNRDFFDDRYQTYSIPGQTLPSYDPNVTKFMRRLVSITESTMSIRVVELGVGDDKFASQQSVFDAMLAKDYSLLYSCSHRWTLADVGYYRTHPMMRSIFYSGIRWVMSPAETKYNSLIEDRQGYEGNPLIKAGIGFKDIDLILPDLGVDEWADPTGQSRYIKRVKEDDYYVFSRAFYEDDPSAEKSWLEQFVLARLKGQTMDLKMLAEMADYAPKFNNLERFYYIPVILWLIKLAPGVL